MCGVQEGDARRPLSVASVTIRGPDACRPQELPFSPLTEATDPSYVSLHVMSMIVLHDDTAHNPRHTGMPWYEASVILVNDTIPIVY